LVAAGTAIPAAGAAVFVAVVALNDGAPGSLPADRRRNVPVRSAVLRPQRVGVLEMGKGLILWLLGVPGVVVILLLVTHII
jgi:hypothetical protein